MSLLCACAVQKILNFVKWPIDTIDIFGSHTCSTPCCQHVFSAAVQPSFYFLLVLTCVCGNVLSRFSDSSHRSRFSSHLYFRNVFAQLERHRTKTIGKRYFLRSDSSQQTARALRVTRIVSSRLHHMMHHRGVAQAVILAVPHSVFNQIVLVPYRSVDYVRCRAEYPKFEFNFPFWLSV